MSQFPVKFVHSGLSLNRADFIMLFGKTDQSATADIRNGERSISAVKVIPADKNLLTLTPSDAIKLNVQLSVIVSERKTDFLRVSLTIEVRGKEKSFDGSIVLLPRKLFINPAEMKSSGLTVGQNVVLGSKTERLTIFGDVRVNETQDSSRFEISPEEAAGALLNEGDMVVLSGTKSAQNSELKPTLPERFLPMELKPGGWITEKSVWQAILKKKKIWVPKGCKITPAAADLGKSRAIFEFEL